MTIPDPALVERARVVLNTLDNMQVVEPDGTVHDLDAERIAAFAAEEAETQTRGQLAATERATETAGKWLRAYQDVYGKLQTTEAREARLGKALKQCTDAFALALSESGRHDEHDQQTDPDTMCLDCWEVRQARAALAEPTG